MADNYKVQCMERNQMASSKMLPSIASFGAHLLAIGGENDSWNPTSDVYRYDFYTNSWHVISQTKNKRAACLAVTPLED